MIFRVLMPILADKYDDDDDDDDNTS